MSPRKKKANAKAFRKAHFSKNKKTQEMPASMLERARNDKLLANRNYFRYLFSLLQRSQLYLFFSHYLAVFRKFKLVALLFRIYSYLLVLLQLGTAFVVIVLGILILLPILALSASSVIFSALLLYRRENKKMGQILANKRIFVYFPTRDGELSAGHFWQAHIKELSEKPNTAVLIVSPLFWSNKGLDKNRFYFLLRQETDNIYLLRKHYYFSLRREILEKQRSSLALIY